jgi:3',5'-cyclic AMP phosphodiesterase CpdA
MSNEVGLPQVRGLMFIGDPHLEARNPGFRRDDYADVAIEKFRWCLKYARDHQLQPILLGDLFQLPQDNPNWLLSAIIESIGEPLPAIYGNHDVRENALKPNDSIQILFASGHLQRLSSESPWIGFVDGQRTIVGGTVWGDRLPKEYPAGETDHALTVWVTHHDIFIPGYEEAGRIRPSEVPGIDLIVNGHVHRRLAPVTKGTTHWVTAGNITRRSRSDASRSHIPAVPCLYPQNASVTDEPVDRFAFTSVSGHPFELRWLHVPHRPFDEVFHPEMESSEVEENHGSGFIADLRELTARRTDTGAGLTEYLHQHVDQFEPAVAAEILRLATEVTSSDSDKKTTTN